MKRKEGVREWREQGVSDEERKKVKGGEEVSLPVRSRLLLVLYGRLQPYNHCTDTPGHLHDTPKHCVTNSLTAGTIT